MDIYYLHTEYDIIRLAEYIQRYITLNYVYYKDFKIKKESKLIKKYIGQIGIDNFYKVLKDLANGKKHTLKEIEETILLKLNNDKSILASK